MINKTAWTAGPWETSATNGTPGALPMWDVCEAGGGDMIADLAACPRNAEANAQLIALAPKMAEALRALRDALGAVTDYGTATGENPDLQNRALDLADSILSRLPVVK